MKIMLVVKAATHQGAKSAIADHLPNAENVRVRSFARNEYRVDVDVDSIEPVVIWFSLLHSRLAPFAYGSLLFWQPIVAPSTEAGM